MNTLKTFAEKMANFGLIVLICILLFACGAKPEPASTPFGEYTYGDQVTPMNLCSVPKEQRPEFLLGRPTSGQCKDDRDV